MKRRIIKSTFFTAFLVLVISLGLVCGAMYRHYSDALFDELRAEAELIYSGIAAGGEEYLELVFRDDVHPVNVSTRITIVDTDGTVLYDSNADESSMENHLDREEIAEALSGEDGEAVRYSKTLTEKSVYIAKLLPDGRVLRVSGTQVRVPSLLFSMRWYIAGAVGVSLALAYFTARYTAKRIVRPINSINPDCPEVSVEYEELSPLISKLNRQKDDIASQMSELRRRQREFTVIAENMREGLLMIDRRAEILAYNSSALELLSADEHDTESGVFALNRSEGFREAVDAALGGEHMENQIPVGEKICRLIVSPVRRHEEVTGAVILILDETEKEQRETLRREFTSNVSHELKTPLTSIYGISDLLLSGMVKAEDVPGFVKNIHHESGRLISLIEDIIRLSRLDEDSAPAQRETVDLFALAEDVAGRLSDNSDGVTFEICGERVEICGVRVILDEMLYNICENAVKYNVPGGKVRVALKSEGENAVITVDDSGIGIPESERTRVFERFYRVDKSHSRKIGGTGLGLSIVKHGASYHGGSVAVADSDLGGTRIVVTLKKE